MVVLLRNDEVPNDARRKTNQRLWKISVSTLKILSQQDRYVSDIPMVSKSAVEQTSHSGASKSECDTQIGQSMVPVNFIPLRDFKESEQYSLYRRALGLVGPRGRTWLACEVICFPSFLNSGQAPAEMSPSSLRCRLSQFSRRWVAR